MTLYWIILCAMLSGASCATLRRIFTCVMLSQEYYDNIAQDVFMLPGASRATLHRAFTCAMLPQEY